MMSDAISNKAPHTEPELVTSTENIPEATSTHTKPAPLLADPEFDMRGLAWKPPFTSHWRVDRNAVRAPVADKSVRPNRPNPPRPRQGAYCARC